MIEFAILVVLCVVALTLGSITAIVMAIEVADDEKDRIRAWMRRQWEAI